jgi:hypothetical protein
MTTPHWGVNPDNPSRFINICVMITKTLGCSIPLTVIETPDAFDSYTEITIYDDDGLILTGYYYDGLSLLSLKATDKDNLERFHALALAIIDLIQGGARC